MDLCSISENLCSREKYGMKVMIAEIKVSFKFLQSLFEVDENCVGLLGLSLDGRLAFTYSTIPDKEVIE